MLWISANFLFSLISFLYFEFQPLIWIEFDFYILDFRFFNVLNKIKIKLIVLKDLKGRNSKHKNNWFKN